MSTNLTINGVVYAFPETGEENWGDVVTAWATAVSNGLLQKSGGNFTLTADIDFGASFGIKSLYLKQRTGTISDDGFIRCVSNNTTGDLAWRNAANSQNNKLYVNASDNLIYEKNGTPINLTTGAAGNVTGPASATDEALARYDGTTGQLIQNSTALLSDSGNLSGVANLTMTGNLSGVVNLTMTGNFSIAGDVLSSLLANTATQDLGSTSKFWRSLYLDNGATDGGAIYFNASSTSFIKCSADGTTLDFGSTITNFTGANLVNTIKVWAYVSETGGAYTLSSSYGVSSITDNGVGNVDVNYTTNFSNAVNYCAIASTNDASAEFASCTKSANKVNVRLWDASASSNDASFNVLCVGDQ